MDRRENGRDDRTRQGMNAISSIDQARLHYVRNDGARSGLGAPKAQRALPPTSKVRIRHIRRRTRHEHRCRYVRCRLYGAGMATITAVRMAVADKVITVERLGTHIPSPDRACMFYAHEGQHYQVLPIFMLQSRAPGNR